MQKVLEVYLLKPVLGSGNNNQVAHSDGSLVGHLKAAWSILCIVGHLVSLTHTHRLSAQGPPPILVDSTYV